MQTALLYENLCLHLGTPWLSYLYIAGSLQGMAIPRQLAAISSAIRYRPLKRKFSNAVTCSVDLMHEIVLIYEFNPPQSPTIQTQPNNVLGVTQRKSHRNLYKISWDRMQERSGDKRTLARQALS